MQLLEQEIAGLKRQLTRGFTGGLVTGDHVRVFEILRSDIALHQRYCGSRGFLTASQMKQIITGDQIRDMFWRVKFISCADGSTSDGTSTSLAKRNVSIVSRMVSRAKTDIGMHKIELVSNHSSPRSRSQSIAQSRP